MESDTDDNINNDGDELLGEDFDSDIIDDTSSGEDVTIDSELEDTDDSFDEESLTEIEDEDDEENGVDGDDEDEDGDEDGDEDDDEDTGENLLLANLKRHNPGLVDSYPLNKRRRSSTPEDFTHLEELLERTNKQISNIYEAVSRMQDCCEMPQTERHRNFGEPLNQTEQATQGQDNPEETGLQTVAETRPEKLVPDFDIVHCDGGAQRNTNVIIASEEPAVEVPLVLLDPEGSIPANDPNGMIYPVIVGLETISTNNVTPLVYIPHNLEMPEIAGASIRNDTVIVHDTTFEANPQDEDNFNPPIFHNFDIPVIPEAVLQGNNETLDYPPAMENSSGQQNSSSSAVPASDSEIKKVVLVEMPEKTEVIVDGNKQTMYCPALLGNVVPPDPETIAASISSEIVIEKLVLIEVPIDPENIVDDNPETQNNPVIPENYGSQEHAAAIFIPSDIEVDNILPIEMFQTGAAPEMMRRTVSCSTSMEHVRDQDEYLGDPRRNVKLSNFHLVTAKNKSTPSYAACYLANVILSEEILLLDSVVDHASRCIFLDQNKMAAIREYLLTVFPNCDLSEQGKDWKDCLSAISFMFESLYTEAEILTESADVPVSTDCRARSHNEGEGPSQWLQEVRESVIRESGNSEQNVNAIIESTDSAAIITDEQVYLGDPSRNTQILYSVLKIAKTQLRPDLSAKYIILHLFPEEVLTRSNVYGNLECGLFALDPNRIGALREFLQDNYPEYDLQENGYYWKLCVTAINNCLQTLRQGPRNVIT